MTGSDCPEPCGCYADDCSCQPCKVKRACLRKVITLMARSSPGLFDLMDAWTLEGHDN